MTAPTTQMASRVRSEPRTGMQTRLASMAPRIAPTVFTA